MEDNESDVLHSLFNSILIKYPFLWVVILIVIFIIIREFWLWYLKLRHIYNKLDSIANSLQDINANNKLSNENIISDNLKNNGGSNTMTCPRCFGKGFVDLNDIKRLGMQDFWDQGFCRYCDGQGEVEKGKTKVINPLNTEIGPSWHKSDEV
jgi:hypothetical protein